MGTSGAYGGSPGWSSTRRDTEHWLDDLSTPSEGGNGGTGTDEPAETPEAGAEQQPPSGSQQPIDPRVVRILGGVSRRLATVASGGAGGTNNAGGGGGYGGGGGARRAQAVTSGGLAVAGAYGLRGRDAGALGDVGLTLANLENLSPFHQAKRIVDAASGESALIDQAEIREVNANFMWWALEQQSPPSPVQLVEAWVTEYVFRAWLTEAGAILRDGSRDGASTHALERTVRLTLEAAVQRADLVVDGLRAVDFQAAIRGLLGVLTRIFGGRNA